MSVWIIEPRDPLIVRDGRPFGPDPGARAASLPFPLPATTTGALRHKVGLDPNGQFDRSATTIERVQQVSVAGPLLVGLNDDCAIGTCYLPAPADALPLKPIQDAGNAESEMVIHRLQPLELPTGAATNAPHATGSPEMLNLVGPRRPAREKVNGNAPHYWRWEAVQAWLGTPPDTHQCAIAETGIAGLKSDSRMHVKIAPATQTADEGFLFQTRGLVFTQHTHQPDDGSQNPPRRFPDLRLALALVSDGATPYFAGGFGPLGGERRLMRWERREQALPIAMGDLPERIAAARACRVYFVTPALFAAGFVPAPHGPLLSSNGVHPTLFAAAVSRYQTISGWDMAANDGRGSPKPTRRLAPAGSVYFIRFGAEDSAAAIAAWVRDRWMTCVSDDAQDRRDGFGLALFGVGPTAAVPMEEPDANA